MAAQRRYGLDARWIRLSNESMNLNLYRLDDGLVVLLAYLDTSQVVEERKLESLLLLLMLI